MRSPCLAILGQLLYLTYTLSNESKIYVYLLIVNRWVQQPSNIHSEPWTDCHLQRIASRYLGIVSISAGQVEKELGRVQIGAFY